MTALAFALATAGALVLGATEGPAPGAPAADATDQVLRIRGTARGGDGALLYLEEHEVRRQGAALQRATTTYLDPEGRTLAVLQTDFSRDPFAPSYRFEDRRRGRVEEVAVGPEGLTLGAGAKRRVLPLPEDARRRLVAGQGLDRYVQHRLEELVGGAELHVTFAIPSRQETYPFRVRAQPARDGDRAVRVRVEIDSWVLRLFASSLDVEYDRATRRLLRYRGPSNLQDERGDNPEVTITYAYPEAGAVARQEVPRAAL